MKEQSDGKMVTVAVPCAEGVFSAHFGGAKAFRLFESDGKRVADRGEISAPEHTPGAFPKWLKSQGVDAVVAGAMGERALGMLMAMGIKVYLAEEGSDVAGVADSCLRGELPLASPGNSGCHGHDEDGCGH